MSCSRGTPDSQVAALGSEQSSWWANRHEVQKTGLSLNSTNSIDGLPITRAEPGRVPAPETSVSRYSLISTSMVEAHQGLFRVLRGDRLNLICQLDTALSAAHQTDVIQISTLKRRMSLGDYKVVLYRNWRDRASFVQQMLEQLGVSLEDFRRLK